MSSVEQKIREVQWEIFKSLIDFDKKEFGGTNRQYLLKDYEKSVEALLQIIESDVIGESEWEDPDIRGSDQSGGDQVEAPWRRNALRESQRANLREDKYNES